MRNIMINGFKGKEYRWHELIPGIYLMEDKYLLVGESVMLYLNYAGVLKPVSYIDLVGKTFTKIEGEYNYTFR